MSCKITPEAHYIFTLKKVEFTTWYSVCAGCTYLSKSFIE